MKISLKKFVEAQAASGLLLAIVTLFALSVANSPLSSQYFELFETKVAGWSLLHWINDGLMTIFFFVVGMEIKKELVAGELSSRAKAALPFAGAIGGMIVPALIYSYFNFGKQTMSGWAVPMATDIAFAMGVISLLGQRVSPTAKVFLLALAIVDDLGAISVIALFYTEKVKMLGLVGAAFCFLMIYFFQKMKVRSYFIYIVMGILAWSATLYSGVHATIAGVVVGLLTPHIFKLSKKGPGQIYPLEKLIHTLHPYVGFLIMPIFAFANAGVNFQNISAVQVLNSSVAWGICLGLLFGKPMGILLFAWLSVKCGLSDKSNKFSWAELLGVSTLAGIGFTMSIFISQLGLPTTSLDIAKFAILISSLLAGLTGYFLLSLRKVKQ